MSRHPNVAAVAVAAVGIRHVEHLLRFFRYEHLPAHLAKVSRPFAELAYTVADLPPSPEVSAALRKLLEAKDCAVRARLTEQE